MKKIYQFVKGVIKFVLGNLDYVAAFVAGAAAYKFAPEQLEATKEAIISFDYASAWMSTKMFIMDSYMYLKGLAIDTVNYFKGDEMAPVMESTTETVN